MSTKSLEGRLRIVDKWVYVNEDDLSAPRDEYERVKEFNWTDGNGDDQVQRQYKARRTLLANTEDQLDVAGGITDVFGNTLTFATVKEIYIENLETVAAAVLKFGQLATPTGGNLLTDLFDGSTASRLKIRAGGVLLIVAPLTGYTVTGGSADKLLISNESSQSISYDIVIKGTGSG